MANYILDKLFEIASKVNVLVSQVQLSINSLGTPDSYLKQKILYG